VRGGTPHARVGWEACRLVDYAPNWPHGAVWHGPPASRAAVPSPQTVACPLPNALNHLSPPPCIRARYLSGELLQGRTTALDKADIFALGATLYELASGSELPKSGPVYQRLRTGKITMLPTFTAQFQNVIKVRGSLPPPGPRPRPRVSPPPRSAAVRRARALVLRFFWPPAKANRSPSLPPLAPLAVAHARGPGAAAKRRGDPEAAALQQGAAANGLRAAHVGVRPALRPARLRARAPARGTQESAQQQAQEQQQQQQQRFLPRSLGPLPPRPASSSPLPSIPLRSAPMFVYISASSCTFSPRNRLPYHSPAPPLWSGGPSCGQRSSTASSIGCWPERWP
jgi:hypothetical protein